MAPLVVLNCLLAYTAFSLGESLCSLPLFPRPREAEPSTGAVGDPGHGPAGRVPPVHRHPHPPHGPRPHQGELEGASQEEHQPGVYAGAGGGGLPPVPHPERPRLHRVWARGHRRTHHAH